MNFRLMKQNKSLLCLVFLLVISSSGCVRDSREGCMYPLRLDFSGTELNTGRNTKSEGADTCHLALYEKANGTLVMTETVTASDLDDNGIFGWHVPSGEYDLTAWSSCSPIYSVVKSDTLQNSTVDIVLDTEEAFVGYGDNHIYFLQPEEIVVTGDYRKSDKLTFRQKSKSVMVTVTGLPTAQLADIQSRISTPWTSCALDGTSRMGAQVTYIPSKVDSQISVSDNFILMALENDDETVLSVRYVPQSGESEGFTIYEGSLVSLITGNPNASIENDETFDIKMTIYGELAESSLHFDIAVNGWVVYHQNDDLE